MAACISADIGVGPSIESGNQKWSGICADFADAPINNKRATNGNKSRENPRIEISILIRLGNVRKNSL